MPGRLQRAYSIPDYLARRARYNRDVGWQIHLDVVRLHITRLAILRHAVHCWARTAAPTLRRAASDP